MKTLHAKKILDYWLGGILLFLLKPFTLLAGHLLRRDHTPILRGRVGILKLMGGGSLTIAFPALLALKKAYPSCPFTLITTREVKPFGEVLNIFDEILVINDQSLLTLVISSIRTLWRSLYFDTVIDLEVYSRLSAVFSLFTMARNRVGFYLENMFWRKGLYSHLVYFNVFGGSFVYYDQLARLLGAIPVPVEECRRHFVAGLPPFLADRRHYRVAIAPGCSTFGQERMLTASHWEMFMLKRKVSMEEAQIFILGSAADDALGEELIAALRPHLPKAEFNNRCGKLPLPDSLALLRSMDEFWGIDSGILHAARLLGISSHSVWGPTDPRTRLRPIHGLQETILYERIACSPCIHVTEAPPCEGNNICIRRMFEHNLVVDLEKSAFTVWPKPPNNSL